MNMGTIRRWHGYLGAIIAPSVVFFALTGTVQLFGLHQAHGGYHPALVIEKLGRLHKDQVFALDEHHGKQPDQPAAAPGAGGQPATQDDDQPAVSVYLLKWYFVLVALSLVVSTVFGIWIGLTRPGGRRSTLGLLVAGSAIPLLLVIV